MFLFLFARTSTNGLTDELLSFLFFSFFYSLLKEYDNFHVLPRDRFAEGTPIVPPFARLSIIVASETFTRTFALKLQCRRYVSQNCKMTYKSWCQN